MTDAVHRGVVLVTCEDDDTRRICQTCLEHAGYLVQVADDPNSALRLAHATPPDVVVTSFPTFTSGGIAVTTLLRGDATFARTPMLSLASWTRQEDLAAASAAGVTESLLMPVELQTLVETVDRLARGTGRGRPGQSGALAPPPARATELREDFGEPRRHINGQRGG